MLHRHDKDTTDSDPSARGWLTGLLALAVLLLIAATGCTAARTPSAAAGGLLPLEDDISLMILPPVENHSEASGPEYTGNYALQLPAGVDELVVVTYNLRYGEAVEDAIAAFRSHDQLAAAGIVLLQEMDEGGVDTFARELGYNYVYYPASVAEDGDNFGNAVLSRWPISDPAKLILPGLHPITGQQRTATRAVTRIGDTGVLVYSTHIEVATAPPSLREEQFAAVLDDIPADAPLVIVGGDFNTVTGWGVDALAEQFAGRDMAHATSEVGPTFTRFGMRPSATDHLFSRGFERLEAGVAGEIVASDHFPVWARLAFTAAPPAN